MSGAFFAVVRPARLVPVVPALPPALRRGLRAAVLSTVTLLLRRSGPRDCRVTSAARLIPIPVHGVGALGREQT
ncbi:hypothetical protein GCM10010129_38300 [Streptomyces fumigatiscleroticus]|nr:hypothetical protein GCM10010129_38300 [Streptomyces fumigatiscleroticus]